MWCSFSLCATFLCLFVCLDSELKKGMPVFHDADASTERKKEQIVKIGHDSLCVTTFLLWSVLRTCLTFQHVSWS